MAAQYVNLALIGVLALLLAVTGLVDSKASGLRKLVKRQTTPSLVCPGYLTNVQNPSDCSSYFECNNNQVTTRWCPAGQVFSPTQRNCGNYPIPPGCTSFSGSSQPTGTYQCPRPDGRFQDTSDCSRFYVCTSNVPQRQQCPTGQLFNPKDQACAFNYEPQGCHESSVVVPVPTPPPITAQGQYQCPISQGTFHDTTDCSKYYDCFHWQGTKRSCPTSQLFDPTTNVCSSIARPVGCHLVAEGGTGFRCPFTDGNYQDVTDCSRYYRCLGGQPTNILCPRNQLFDTSRAQCSGTITFVAGCTMTSVPIIPPTTGAFTCPSRDGEFPNPNDCSQLWRCDNFIPNLKNCPGTLLFNPVRGYCDWPTALGPNPTSCRLITRLTPLPLGPEGVTCPTSVQATHIPHPRICNAFYTCGEGRLHTPCTFCAEGTYFDTVTNECRSDRELNVVTTCPGKVMVPQTYKTQVQANGC